MAPCDCASHAKESTKPARSIAVTCCVTRGPPTPARGACGCASALYIYTYILIAAGAAGARYLF